MSWFLWRETWSKVLSSTCGYSVFRVPFVEVMVLSPVGISDTFDENRSHISVWCYFWIPYSVPLGYILFQAPDLFLVLSFALGFEIRYCDASNFAFFVLRIVLPPENLQCLHMNFKIFFLALWKLSSLFSWMPLTMLIAFWTF